MQGGMQWLGVHELATAVSNAGGLGTINASCYPKADDFRQAIVDTLNLTNKPFAINIFLTPDAVIRESTITNIQIAGEENVVAIETADNPITEMRKYISKANMIYIHKCTSLRHAIRAEKDGAHMVYIYERFLVY